MKVSVVIPAYNEETSLAQTLEAVIAQSYADKEIIVVNNESTDGTAEVAARYPVRVVLEAQKGLLHARDRGRREATGEIVVNIDADCLPDPTWLARGLVHFKDARIVAVTGPYDYYDASRTFRNISLWSQRYVYGTVTWILQLPGIKKGAVLIGGNNFIRKRVLDEMGGYNTSILFYGEDTDTATRVAKYGLVKLDRSLTMKTSARRFKSEGTFKITVKYLFHFFNTLIKRSRVS